MKKQVFAIVVLLALTIFGQSRANKGDIVNTLPDSLQRTYSSASNPVTQSGWSCNSIMDTGTGIKRYKAVCFNYYSSSVTYQKKGAFKAYTTISRLPASVFAKYTTISRLPASVFANYTTINRVTSIATTSPILGGPITSSGTLSLASIPFKNMSGSTGLQGKYVTVAGYPNISGGTITATGGITGGVSLNFTSDYNTAITEGVSYVSIGISTPANSPDTAPNGIVKYFGTTNAGKQVYTQYNGLKVFERTVWAGVWLPWRRTFPYTDAPVYSSTVATGTAPLVVASTTGVANLSVQSLYQKETAPNASNFYESGEWTVTVTPDSGSVTLKGSPVWNIGWFVRVGRLVTFGANVMVLSVSSPTGYITIGGLPYSSVSAYYYRTAIKVNALTLTGTLTSSLSGQFNTNASTIYVFDGDNATWGDHLKENSQLQISGSYIIP